MREERVLDILVYLYEEYLCADEVDDFDALHKDLEEAGFHDASIEHAFSWLEGVVDASDKPEPVVSGRSEHSLRIFSEKEMQHFSKEAQGFLHLLEQNNLLDGFCQERVIERAMALQPKGTIDLEQMQWVVLFVLYHYPGMESQFESYEGLFFSEDVTTLH